MSALAVLERCECCRGRGWIQGIFHRMECAACNGGGLVRPDGTALAYPQLVEQLKLRADAATARLARIEAGLPRAVTGPAADYQGMSNRRRPGGGNWTGD